jgi:cytochrome c
MCKKWFLLGSFAILLTGCGSFAAGPGGGDPHVGAQLYVKYGCITCHGTNGQGPRTPGLARDLTNDYSEANYALLRYFLLVDPPKGMEYAKSLPLTPQQIADLNAFDNESSLLPTKALGVSPAPPAISTPASP